MWMKVSGKQSLTAGCRLDGDRCRRLRDDKGFYVTSPMYALVVEPCQRHDEKISGKRKSYGLTVTASSVSGLP